jgi:hypothetical protein
MNSRNVMQEKPLNPFGSDPSVKWAVSYEVVLGDAKVTEMIKRSPWYKIWTRHPQLFGRPYNKDGSLGYIFDFLVCSPAFRADPEPYCSRKDASNSFVQTRYNEEKAKSYLEARINSIGERTVEQIGEEFSTFLHTEEWDFDLQPKV